MCGLWGQLFSFKTRALTVPCRHNLPTSAHHFFLLAHLPLLLLVLLMNDFLFFLLMNDLLFFLALDIYVKLSWFPSFIVIMTIIDGSRYSHARPDTNFPNIEEDRDKVHGLWLWFYFKISFCCYWHCMCVCISFSSYCSAVQKRKLTEPIKNNGNPK